MSAPPAIALVGLRCVGKTSVGRELARRLGLGFVDLDDAVAWAAGEGCCAAHVPSVAELIAVRGLQAFRELEALELGRALAHDRPFVLATGGGVVELAPNRALLRSRARCVWLREELAVLQRRLASDPAARPALLGADAVAELAELERRREPWYREVAWASIDSQGRVPDALAADIQALLEAAH